MSRSRRPRVLVVGDVLLDRDVDGRVERICPDSPAPVLDVDSERPRAGGAGLAATLLARAGADVDLVGPVGDDRAGGELVGLLEESGVRLHRLPAAGPTRVKARLRSAGTVLVRMDTGGDTCPPRGLGEVDLARLIERADAVLVSDYGGGCPADPEVRATLERHVGHRPVVWDPHPRGAEPVPGAAAVTPNRDEALSLAGISARDGRDGPRGGHRGDAVAGIGGLRAARDAAEALAARWRAHAVAVTLGAQGALLSYGSGPPLVVPAEPSGGDACGAGDALAAALTRRLAQGDLPAEAMTAAVAEAARFVATGGVAALTAAAPRPPSQARRTDPPHARGSAPRQQAHGHVPARTGGVDRTGILVATGGCFDLLHAGHVALIQAARRLGDRLVVLVNSDESVRRLKGPDRPLVSCADRVRVLRALEAVDEVIVFDEDRPDEALRRLRPDIWAKGGDYAELPEADVVAEWGGLCVTLPYLAGRSTSQLLALARTDIEEEELP